MSESSGPLLPNRFRVQADHLQEIIERGQRDKWIAEDRTNGIVRVDTRDEATVEKVARVIGSQQAPDGFDVRVYFTEAREVLAALEEPE